MNLRGSAVAFATILALGVASSANASVTWFTSQSAFLAATGASTFGFNAGGSLVVNPNPLTTNGVTFSDNVTTNDVVNGGTPILFTVPAAFTPTYGVDFLAFQNTQVDILGWISNGASKAFGFTYGSYLPVGPATLTLSTGDWTTITPDTTAAFIGYVSTTPVTGVDLNYPGAYSFDVINVSTAGVPEPAEWALLIAGMAGLGGMLRRRRETAAA